MAVVAAGFVLPQLAWRLVVILFVEEVVEAGGTTQVVQRRPLLAGRLAQSET